MRCLEIQSRASLVAARVTGAIATTAPPTSVIKSCRRMAASKETYQPMRALYHLARLRPARNTRYPSYGISPAEGTFVATGKDDAPITAVSRVQDPRDSRQPSFFEPSVSIHVACAPAQKSCCLVCVAPRRAFPLLSSRSTGRQTRQQSQTTLYELLQFPRAVCNAGNCPALPLNPWFQQTRLADPANQPG